MAVADRFDIGAAREEARLEKQAKKIKMIVSYCVLAVIILALVIGGKFGIDAWRESRERAAEEAREAERQEIARIKKEKAKREKEMAEKVAERERIRKQQEEERERLRKERDAERERKMEAQRKERAEREAQREAERRAMTLQRELKRYGEDALKTVTFKLEDHVAMESQLSRAFSFDTEDPLWQRLVQAVSSRSAPLFFDAIETKENAREGEFYTRETITAKLEKLRTTRFKMKVISETGPEACKTACIYKVDPEEGLVPPGDEAVVKNDGSITGWCVDFVFGEGKTLFLMTTRKAERLQGEWNAKQREIRQTARRNGLNEQTVASLREKWAADFAELVRAQIQVREPAEDKVRQEKSPQEQKADARKERLERMKSGGSSGGWNSGGSSNNRRPYQPARRTR